LKPASPGSLTRSARPGDVGTGRSGAIQRPLRWIRFAADPVARQALDHERPA